MHTEIVQKSLLKIPYAATLGVKPIFMGSELTLVLPYDASNIGNPALPALHGGCIGGFMEMAAIAQLMMVDKHARIPKPIGINIDYLRRGRPEDTFARAQVFKQGNRVSNVRVRAWQEDYDRPIATMAGHFLIAESDPKSGE